MPDFDYDVEQLSKQLVSKQTEILRLSMPRLEYAKRAALADLDPGQVYAELELNRVFPILIYLEKEDKEETEVRCRFLMYELLAAARFNVIAELELSGSKLLFFLPRTISQQHPAHFLNA